MRVATLLLGLFAIGCTPFTEVVVRVDNAGLEVPTDVATVSISVTNPVDGED